MRKEPMDAASFRSLWKARNRIAHLRMAIDRMSHRISGLSEMADAGAMDHEEIESSIAEVFQSENLPRHSFALPSEAKPKEGFAIRIHSQDGRLLPRCSSGASGYDLFAIEDAYLPPGKTLVINTGICLEMPPGFEAQVRPRSSWSKRGVMVQLGTIDNDYRGPIGVIMHNASSEVVAIQRIDRIAQLVFARVEHPERFVVGELSETTRGSGGFGSTGR